MICTKLELCVREELAGEKIANCDNRGAQCIEVSDHRSLVKCEEKNKKYTLENTLNSHVISYKMDGGVIVEDASVPEGINKCDYLYVVNSAERTAVLIELKGENVSKALKQLQATLIQYKDFFRTFSHVYGRTIVVSSTPDLKASPAYVNLAKLLKSVYHGNIKIVERQFVEKDVDLEKEQ